MKDLAPNNRFQGTSPLRGVAPEPARSAPMAHFHTVRLVSDATLSYAVAGCPLMASRFQLKERQ